MLASNRTPSAVRSRLMHTRNYTAQPNWPNTVGWSATGNGHELVDTKVSTTDTTDAVAVIVGRISSSRLMIGPAGNYNPDYNKSLSVAKFQFTLIAPGPGTFHTDFNVAVDAIESVQNAIANTTDKKFFILKDGQSRTLRFSQPMFEQKEISSEVDEEDLITTWPIPSEHNEALQTITETHKVLPLIAYDENDALISPEQTTSKLEGALVELYFGMKHYHIANTLNSTPYDSYTGVIEQIIILEKATPKRPSQFRKNVNKGPTRGKMENTGKFFSPKKQDEVHPYKQSNDIKELSNSPNDEHEDTVVKQIIDKNVSVIPMETDAPNEIVQAITHDVDNNMHAKDDNAKELVAVEPSLKRKTIRVKSLAPIA